MVDSFQSFDEHLLCHRHVAERDGAILVEAIVHLLVDNPAHEIADARLGIFGKRARGSLDGVCHHQDCLLTGEGVRTGISERSLVHLLVGMLVLVGYIEILRYSRAVMGADEILYHSRQV